MSFFLVREICIRQPFEAKRKEQLPFMHLIEMKFSFVIVSPLATALVHKHAMLFLFHLSLLQSEQRTLDGFFSSNSLQKYECRAR